MYVLILEQSVYEDTSPETPSTWVLRVLFQYSGGQLERFKRMFFVLALS